MVMGRLPQLFPEPDRFKPERWSTDAEDTPNVFASLSFGYGPRLCVGKCFFCLLESTVMTEMIKFHRAYTCSNVKIIMNRIGIPYILN